jgi:hypothetical protein
MDTRKILMVVFFVVVNLSWISLACCRRAPLGRASKILRGVAIAGIVIGVVGAAWLEFRGDPLEPQAKELAKRAAEETGRNPTYAQAEEWLQRNGFWIAAPRSWEPEAGDRRRSYVCISGWKTLAEATSPAHARSVEIDFFWEWPSGRYFGVEHSLSFFRAEPPAKQQPAPAKQKPAPAMVSDR